MITKLQIFSNFVERYLTERINTDISNMQDTLKNLALAYIDDEDQQVKFVEWLNSNTGTINIHLEHGSIGYSGENPNTQTYLPFGFFNGATSRWPNSGSFLIYEKEIPVLQREVNVLLKCVKDLKINGGYKNGY